MEEDKRKFAVPDSLLISRADNGYVLSYLEELDTGEVRRHRIAVEEPEDGDEARAAQRMLWEVLEHFGVYKGVRVLLKGEKP